MPYAILLVPVLATLVGGLLAVRFRRWVHILLALGAGLLLGAAFLDLLPEAVALGMAAQIPVIRTFEFTLVSFLAFFLMQMALDALSSGKDALVPRHSLGRIAGSFLVFHSFRDGMAIGAAFGASPVAGYAVAVGIAAHDLGDGMNTVLLTTAGEKPGPVDYGFLLADALAPFLGALVAARWFSTASSTVALLAIAAGFFLQMAASDFLPEIRRRETARGYLVGCVFAGAAFIYFTNILLGQTR